MNLTGKMCEVVINGVLQCQDDQKARNEAVRSHMTAQYAEQERRTDLERRTEQEQVKEMVSLQHKRVMKKVTQSESFVR